MTDREMLELAAKAVRVIEAFAQCVRGQLHRAPSGNITRLDLSGNFHEWNPMTDDGDAFRLLCDKSMRIVESNGGAYRAVQFTVHPETADEAVHEVEIEWPHTPAATRFAITRAAASIGEKMP